MAYYAFIGFGQAVTEVIVGRDETDLIDGVDSWASYYGTFRGQVCIETNIDTLGGVHYTDGEPSADQSKALRFNYAGLGFSYDENRDAFIPPQPYASWVLDEDTCLWVAPIAYPADADTVAYIWAEDTISWIAISDPY